MSAAILPDSMPSRKPDEIPPTLRAAYGAWRDHHDRCPTCGANDWFEPGAPRIIPIEKAEPWHGRIKNRFGKEFAYANYYDLTVLCAFGAELFKKWVRAAGTSTVRA